MRPSDKSLRLRSPGYGLTLVAQSTTSVLHSAEALSPSSSTPEDIGLTAARQLLEELQTAGCVDRQHQWLVLLMMVLGKEDVGRCLMGQLTAQRLVRYCCRCIDWQHPLPERS